MNSRITAWDKDYQSRGRLWGGNVKGIPDQPMGSRVLELGCGSGKTLSAMQERPWKIVALDFSQEALRLSRSGNPYIDLLLADVSCLPFHDRSFDAIFAFHITGHLLQDKRELLAAEVARVMRGDGRFFFREFELNDMRKGQGAEVERLTFRRGKGVITHYFTEEETINLFSELLPISIKLHKWKMRVAGRDFFRAEIDAVFSKR
ncbi:MAG: class I SAM-dependent methyltransferase [Methanotrichaceae archaeon]|nr:class I SAM-dependent methyltransferase [Methanotrichaceae archaeon]